MKQKAETMGEFLASLPAEQRATLQKLRRAIKSAAPKAEECISYGIPAFRHEGRILVWFGAAKNHCSLFPGAHPIVAHKAALKGYSTSKGTVRFAVDEPLPPALVKKLVKTRIAEFAAKKPAKRARGQRATSR